MINNICTTLHVLKIRLWRWHHHDIRWHMMTQTDLQERIQENSSMHLVSSRLISSWEFRHAMAMACHAGAPHDALSSAVMPSLLRAASGCVGRRSNLDRATRSPVLPRAARALHFFGHMTYGLMMFDVVFDMELWWIGICVILCIWYHSVEMCWIILTNPVNMLMSMEVGSSLQPTWSRVILDLQSITWIYIYIHIHIRILTCKKSSDVCWWNCMVNPWPGVEMREKESYMHLTEGVKQTGKKRWNKPTNPNAVTSNTIVRQVIWTVYIFPLLPYQCTVDCGMRKRVECKV